MTQKISETVYLMTQRDALTDGKALRLSYSQFMEGWNGCKNTILELLDKASTMQDEDKAYILQATRDVIKDRAV